MSTPAVRSGRRPRVVLVDDHGIFRSGVRSELGPRVEVVGEAEDVWPAVELIGQLLPDVVLLDVHQRLASPACGGRDEGAAEDPPGTFRSSRASSAERGSAAGGAPRTGRSAF